MAMNKKVLMNASKKVSNSLKSLGEQDFTDDVKKVVLFVEKCLSVRTARS